MLNLLTKFVFGNSTFGLMWNDAEDGRPYLSVFGFEIYLYALIIVSGMAVAILVSALYFKKRGLDPYDATIYALVVIPLGVLGARLYVYIFPWSGGAADWETFFDFRQGGLGIYGGVIMGYLSGFVCATIRKQDFRIVTDSLLPGVMIAQSMGRWGNYFNVEAYGNLITEDYSALPNWFEKINHGPLHGFNGYAVWVDADHVGIGQVAGWYQATFFYESVCTLVGFLICVLVLTRSKHYKLGWCTAFYGIYYGIVRLVIEGMRSDSLYLYLGTRETDIKISQLVSIFTIVLGLLLLSQIYRKQLHALYRKMFKTEKRELEISRWVLLGISVASLGVGITMFALGGESKFILGFFLTALAIYAGLGIWSLCDRLKLYCDNCSERHLPAGGWQTERSKVFTQVVAYSVICGVFFAIGLFGIVKMGVKDGAANGYVLAIVALICIAATAVWKLMPALRRLRATPQQSYDGSIVCDCGEKRTVKLNSFLLFLYPPKVYRDYGVENLKPWVDPKKQAKLAAQAGEAASSAAPETAPEAVDAPAAPDSQPEASAPTESGDDK